jgi:epoxyqueuosine reductase
MTDLTVEVKNLALSNLDYVGIASVNRLDNEPENHRPADFLPGAQTVISIGIRLSQGVQLANKLAHNHLRPRHVIYPYLWHGFGLPSLHYVDRTALLITRKLEKEGFIAVPIMSASTFGVRHSLTEFSNIHAAVAAGLGDLGWCDLVITPDSGPRVRFGSIITTARLEPDEMYNGPTLCQPEKCGDLRRGRPVCAAICPTQAIRATEEEVRIGSRNFKSATVDTWRCTWGSLGLSKKSGGVKDIPMPEQIGPEEVYAALSKRDASQIMETMVIGRGDYCGRCLMECPVGKSPEVPAKKRSSLTRLKGES